jgi:hypothetical protein
MYRNYVITLTLLCVQRTEQSGGTLGVVQQHKRRTLRLQLQNYKYRVELKVPNLYPEIAPSLLEVHIPPMMNKMNGRDKRLAQCKLPEGVYINL